MPWYNEEMVGFGFSFFLSFSLLKRETNSMQILDLIFQCWLVSEDPGMKRWLSVSKILLGPQVTEKKFFGGVFFFPLFFFFYK